MRVAVDHQIGAATLEDLGAGTWRSSSDLRFETAPSCGRMVQHHQAEAIGVGRIGQGRVEARELVLAQPAGGQVRRGGRGRAEVEDRDRTSDAHLREAGASPASPSQGVQGASARVPRGRPGRRDCRG
ncbi:hypothetical protein [Devosia sp.]|uniref:hypothetical protein n=1 Tax=Devosia sp. TaxID=1871048 RepID=UPI0025FD4CE1|nr:hypothetical protein [Devosia sp.]MCR6634221.1 hypothetical protein [Devosia sp.]